MNDQWRGGCGTNRKGLCWLASGAAVRFGVTALLETLPAAIHISEAAAALDSNRLL